MKKSPSAALAEKYNSVVRERHVVNILCFSSGENHQNNMRIPTYCKKWRNAKHIRGGDKNTTEIQLA